MLLATWDTLMEQGVDGLTFSEIGRRAGVNATSVQRRWGSRENVLFDALISFGSEAIAVPDTGSLRSDLIGMSKALSNYFASPLGVAILKMLTADAADDHAFATHRSQFIRIRFDAMRGMIQRAHERGNCSRALIRRSRWIWRLDRSTCGR